MAKWLILQKCELSQTHVIMEATGIYHEYLACGLHQMGILTSVINPCRSREFAKAMGIFTKTDAVDAYVLAFYGCLKQPEAWTPPEEEVRKLRALLQHRDSLLNDKLRIDNRLNTLKSTEAVQEVMDSLSLVNQYLKSEVARIERLISSHIAQHPGLKRDLKLLMSVDGIEKQIGWNMLAVLRGNNFKSAEQLAAYLGVVPVERRSGTSVHGRARLSKIGSSNIRAKLYMGALTAISKNSHIKALYERLLAKGKMKMSALGAAMRKLVHLCYGVLHTQQPYDEKYKAKIINFSS
ncbi:IS110 family transposase [Salmonella enterica]|nr:IS110 family transposase [Salmonella enterica]